MTDCPICGVESSTLSYFEFSYAKRNYILIHCTGCGCMYYKDDFYFDFKNNFEHNRNLKTYLEKTSDLEGLITIVSNFIGAYPDTFRKGIEIGCGAGLLMDFAESIMNQKMTGFEPSAFYSKEGKETLGLDIIEDFFSKDLLINRSIDFALCFQVLHMADDPEILLKDVRQVLGEKGVLLLSTPDNECIDIKGNITFQIQALSPGVHRILFSYKSLMQLLQKCGYKDVRIFKKDGQLFAIASDTPIPDIKLFIMNREAVLQYYLKKLLTLKKDSSYFKGIWYRYYRNKIDHGEYEEAIGLLKEATWFNIWSEQEIEQIHTIDQLFKLNSTVDAIIYYYTGIIFLNHLQKHEYAEKLFHLSFLLCKKVIQIQPEMCTVESDIIWLSKLHNVMAKIYQNKKTEAKEELIRLLSATKTNLDVLPAPPQQVVQKAERLITNLS